MNSVRIISCACVCAIMGALLSCASAKSVSNDAPRYRKPGAYNFRFVGYDARIDNPDRDRRSYYRVFLDKEEAGRTTIGLESQDKYFEAGIEPNRHLLSVEKWVLDEKMGRYVKLNNIEQPRPNFVYFGVPEGRIVVVRMKNDARENRAVFEVDFEYE